MARGSIGSEQWRRAWQRESRLLARVRHAAWRREMAELERTWAVASAHAEGVSIRTIATAAGLGPTRVHAIVRDAELDGLDAALGELRSRYGWPAPEDPEGSRDEELTGREMIADRLRDEVQWLRDCARWLEQLEVGEYPPVVNLRPDADHPDRCNIVVDLDRVRRMLRIAADVDELARARTVEDLEHAQIDPDVRADAAGVWPSRRSRSPLMVVASASTARRCMSSRRNAGAAGRPTRTRSTAASTRRRTRLATRRGGRRERWCSPKRTACRCFLLRYYPDPRLVQLSPPNGILVISHFQNLSRAAWAAAGGSAPQAHRWQ